MLHMIHEIIDWVAVAIDIVASAIMIWAFLVSAIGFLRASFGGSPSERIRRLQVERCGLGIKLVFALELLIISDLLHTVETVSKDVQLRRDLSVRGRPDGYGLDRVVHLVEGMLKGIS